MTNESFRFSTRELPAHQRVAAWREQFGRGMLRVDLEPVSDEGFAAEAAFRRLPGLRMVSCANSAMRFDRRKEFLRDGDDSIGIVLNLGKGAVVGQGRNEFSLRPGDAAPIFTAEAAHLVSTRHVGLLFPYAAIASRCRDPAGLTRCVIRRGAEPVRLLSSYIRMIRDKASLSDPALRDAVVNHVHDLAALALAPQRARDYLNAIAAGRLAAALEDIGKRFGDPGLTASEVARSQNISTRYLHRLIESTGKPLSAHLNDLRLERAYALLSEPAYRHQRISDIALQCGFSDISYFNRQFRARFGDTPSGVRRDAKP